MPIWFIVTAAGAALGALLMIASTVIGGVLLTRGCYEEEVIRWFVTSVIGLAVMLIGAIVIVCFGYGMY